MPLCLVIFLHFVHTLILLLLSYSKHKICIEYFLTLESHVRYGFEHKREWCLRYSTSFCMSHHSLFSKSPTYQEAPLTFVSQILGNGLRGCPLTVCKDYSNSHRNQAKAEAVLYSLNLLSNMPRVTSCPWGYLMPSRLWLVCNICFWAVIRSSVEHFLSHYKWYVIIISLQS